MFDTADKKPTPPLGEDNILTCAHCGDLCDNGSICEAGAFFCCNGCLTVFNLLHSKNLSSYYKIDQTPGLKPELPRLNNKFAYLDKADVAKRLLSFNDNSIARITFNLPQIHCSSCVWLLENLFRINDSIINSRVDFQRRKATVTFKISELPLSGLAQLMSTIGYEPDINLASLDQPATDKSFREIYAKIAVAGFCFGNIMLLSFPEYLGLDSSLRTGLNISFDYIKVLLSLPLIFYSATIYFKATLSGLKNRMINMDLPISLGIAVLFLNSMYEVLWAGQAGYFDSLSALVFCLLIGKWYQKKTYFSLSFSRDYKSYLPISVTKIIDGADHSVPVEDLAIGDIIIIRNNEIIPADAALLSSQATIDYSYVTGESAPQKIEPGELVYAGGRIIGDSAELKAVKEPSRSFLLELWEQTENAVKKQIETTTLANRLSYYFTPSVILLALATLVYWQFYNPALSIKSAVAVLIVACPCALALSSPFVLGTAQRLLGKAGLFLKDGSVVEKMAGLSGIVFDKTGTITQSGAVIPEFMAKKLETSKDTAELSDKQKALIHSLTRLSNHPLSRIISDYLSKYKIQNVENFVEKPGLGIAGIIDGNSVRLGSQKWLSKNGEVKTADEDSLVYVSINDQTVGYFRFANLYRKELDKVVANLSNQYSVAMLTGDNDSERNRLEKIFPKSGLHFNQSPQDKLQFVNQRIIDGAPTAMIGDGLNDAGALKAATVGLAVADDRSAFSPASDGILLGKSFYRLPNFLRLAKDSVVIIKISFILSLLYNAVGLYFAMTGALSPVIAAILMPASSVSVILFTTAATTIMAGKRGLVR